MDFKYQRRYMLAGIDGVGYYELMEYDETNYDEEDEVGDFEYISGTLYTNEKQDFSSPHTVNGYFQEEVLGEETAEWVQVVNGKASANNKQWVTEIEMLL